MLSSTTLKAFRGLQRGGLRYASSSTSAMAYKALHRNTKRPILPTVENPTLSPDSAVSSIIYETPLVSNTPKTQHVLNCLVQNEPGVLSLISGTLAARGFNIDSLVVCNTEVKDLSRMTIVLDGQDGVIEQARKQIEDLVPVYAVLDYSHTQIVQRELLLCRVSLLGPEYFQELVAHHNEEDENVGKRLRSQTYHPNNLPPSQALRQKYEHLDAISKLTKTFGGKVVDVSDRNCIVELAAKSSRVSAFIALIQPFGILELARSGLMALPRTPIEGAQEDGTDPTKDAADVVDVSQLPPG
ncbi:acetolactate synthase regulatory subunit [Martiniozyma asiatica (nom. inval.)]|nr:acetolactate synthase regulatory subunit [Martiniozyma asiatica]